MSVKERLHRRDKVGSSTIDDQALKERIRRAASRITTPLMPDDYLSTLVNPLWSARTLRGRIEEVVRETPDAATLRIKPGWGWSFESEPGQYVGIGVEVDGRLYWRSYSLTSPPRRENECLEITVKAMPEGFLSEHLVRGVERGTIVRLARPQGDFVLPDPPPPHILFLTAGSGVTPVIAMLRTLGRRGSMPDITMIHSSHTERDALFREELLALSERHPNFRLLERFSSQSGRLRMNDLDDLCPDWRERQTWACGPEAMLDDAERRWKSAGLRQRLHVERFAPVLDAAGGAGGHVTFASSGKEVDIDGATTLLEAGEQLGIEMPFGCRMGVCHTCVVPLVSGRVRDLRNGREYTDGTDSAVQTCCTAPAGDCVLEV